LAIEATGRLRARVDVLRKARKGGRPPPSWNAPLTDISPTILELQDDLLLLEWSFLHLSGKA